ncbi:unnamed protein product [Bursaphelenchus okinawaensis]|uniref:TBC1 domain family member 15 n=1 Tax=Bursaphelenchus okinawaensis TaxID=465554 RepID=A0A811K9R6_9BILA|nr:unnamed protein product [Bursaphelenchus okinawaensis]CAG9096288.1 unnamed protein product [Bursaphelenchus okinawaensis]
MENTEPFGAHEETTFIICEVHADVVNSNTGQSGKVNGVLSVVEKPHGIYIEWKPAEIPAPEDEIDQSWVIEGRNSNPPSPSGRSLGLSYNALLFSTDVKDLRSFKFGEPAQGNPWVQFICKDGSVSHVLHFEIGGYTDFVTHLQKYITLTRSSKEKNLVVVVDPRADALEKSVGMLNIDRDIVSRFISNPYATSMTALSKVTSFMAPLLDPDAVINEHQIKALHQFDPSTEEMNKLRVHNEAGFEHIFKLELPDRPNIPSRDQPVNTQTFDRFKASDGRILDVHQLKSLVFRGGLEDEVRQVLWKYLLDYWKWDLSVEENKQRAEKLKDDYYRMKLQWMSINEDQENRFAEFRDRKALIDKDVARTDRSHPFFKNKDNLAILKDILMTYVMYDFDLGYVQGMSDYLSPLLVVMENEYDAFWTFVGLMKRVHKNFEMDQLAIKKQLADLRAILEIVNPKLTNYLEGHDSDHMYFCFRWILVAFKREFGFDDIMTLWEVLWSDIPCKNFLLLICAAILDGEENMIIVNKFGLTEILKHVNNMSMKLDLSKVLRDAEAIFHQLAAVQDKLPRHICEILGFGFDESTQKPEV